MYDFPPGRVLIVFRNGEVPLLLLLKLVPQERGFPYHFFRRFPKVEVPLVIFDIRFPNHEVPLAIFFETVPQGRGSLMLYTVSSAYNSPFDVPRTRV